MTFFQLIRREMHGSLPRLMVMSALGGLSNAALLASINAAAQTGTKSEKPSLWAAGLFIVSLLLFLKTQNYILITATVEIESIIHKLRVRVMDKVRQSELSAIEGIGRARIFSSINSDTVVLSQAASMLAFSMQSVVLIILVGLYVAYLSMAAFLLSSAIVAAAGAIFHFQGRNIAAGRQEAAEWGNRLFDRMSDVLDGFKEVRLNKRRSDQLIEDVDEASRTAAYVKIKTEADSFKRMIFSQLAMFILLGGVVFIAPQLSSLASSMTKVILALLFVVGASFGLVQSIPTLSQADGAADRIAQLEADLTATARSEELSADELSKSFEKIELQDVVYRYFDRSSETTFQVGPVNFELNRGELVFITGGNGSGKSTFLKLLAGLYVPESGQITLDDGMRIDNSTRERYRALLAAVFTYYHLFLRLYGITEPDPAEVASLLRQFRLDTKTRLTGGEFKTLDLSAGQRKRLALIVGLLEKRPILLLDEWASDQDPEYRRKFYNDLLPELAKAGVTIVAVTHDDRYLNEIETPCRKLHMDEGRFVS
jgi:putative ATP-binding cassette transporter